MFVSLDVDYRPDGTARAAAVAFDHWQAAAPIEQVVVRSTASPLTLCTAHIACRRS